MTDQELLQAIGKMMDEMLDKKISAAEQRIMKGTVTLMDTQFAERFNLLAEGQEEILRRMPNEDDMDIIDGRLQDLEHCTRRHNKQIEELQLKVAN